MTVSASGYRLWNDRSADKRTAWFAILLFNSLLFGTFLFHRAVAPGFLVTMQNGTKFRGYALETDKPLEVDARKGFDVQTANGVRRIAYDLNGIRKLEVLSSAGPKVEQVATPRGTSQSSKTDEPRFEFGPPDRYRLTGDEYEVHLSIESFSGELIQGAAKINGDRYYPPWCLSTSWRIWTNDGQFTLDVLEVRSIERESSVLYEWSKRLF